MSCARTIVFFLFCNLFQKLEPVSAFCIQNNHDLQKRQTFGVPKQLYTNKKLNGNKRSTGSSCIMNLTPLSEQNIHDFSSDFSILPHVALDFATTFGRNAALLKSILVLGHIFSLASDYLPNHNVSAHEMIFHLGVLLLASGGLAKSIAPMLTSDINQKESTSLSYRKRKTFSLLFNPVGVTWSQFQALSSDTLEWLDVEPERTIFSSFTAEYTSEMQDGNCTNYAYWVLGGKVEVRNNEHTSKTISHYVGKGLVGDAKTIWNIENYLQEKKSLSLSTSGRGTNEVNDMTLSAGKEGATLLRIDLRRLKNEMRHDEKLAQSFRLFLMKGMLNKEGMLMEACQGAIL